MGTLIAGPAVEAEEVEEEDEEEEEVARDCRSSVRKVRSDSSCTTACRRWAPTRQASDPAEAVPALGSCREKIERGEAGEGERGRGERLERERGGDKGSSTWLLDEARDDVLPVSQRLNPHENEFVFESSKKAGGVGRG